MSSLKILSADLTNPVHTDAILQLTDAYSRDPMGRNRPLSDDIKSRLIHEMRAFPSYLGFIAFWGDKPAGIANCVYSFSTFYAARVINIHDLAVSPDFRGKGIGQSLMNAVEEKAKSEGCHKITLEVREDNRARNLYERAGFRYGTPRMLFMEKQIR